MTELAIIERGLVYASSVASGERDAPRWVRLAVDRFFDDLKPGSPWNFDPERAEVTLGYIEAFRHYKGPKAGEKIELEGWQAFVLMQLFGFVDPKTGARRYREGFIAVPRGNGKTTLLAAVGLVMAFIEGEGGAEVYSAAVTRDQARICFDDARMMAQAASPRDPKSRKPLPWGFAPRYSVEVFQHQLRSSSGAVFRPLSADAKSLDGLNVHLGILDELASHRTSEVYDAIKTGAAKRRQPLVLSITTATSNTAGIGRSTWNYAEKVLQGTIEDDRFFGIMWTVDEGDDFWSETTWRKANPNWGVSVDPDSFASNALKAQQNPSGEAAFKTRHLNIWEGADQAMFSMRAWNRAKVDLTLEDFVGEPCFIGIDLATSVDLCGKVYLFERDGIWYTFARAYLPKAAIEEQRVAQYAEWIASGHLVEMPGEAIDLDRVETEVIEDASRFRVRAYGFDPWQATQMMQRVEKATNRDVYEVRPITQHMTEACKELQRRMVSGLIAHDGNPVFGWCISNVVGLEDPAGNIKPAKMRNELKIDLAVGLIMAAACKLRTPVEEKPMVY